MLGVILALKRLQLSAKGKTVAEQLHQITLRIPQCGKDRKNLAVLIRAGQLIEETRGEPPEILPALPAEVFTVFGRERRVIHRKPL